MSSKPNNFKKAKNRKMMYLFFVTFFLSMVLLGGLIKTLSPNVDVEIGDGVQQEDTTEEADNQGVDNRLKWIQFEDNMPGVSKRLGLDGEPSEDEDSQDNTNTQNEKVKQTRVPLDLDDEIISTNPNAKHQASGPPVPNSFEVIKQTAPVAPIKMSKVYIGYYTNIEQAIAAQNKIIDTNLNVSPFVKEVNGYYVVQVGSYANRQKAQSLATEVQAQGFPAKVVAE